MSEFDSLWKKLRKSKKYRESFVAAQVKRGIPFQIRRLMKQEKLSQAELAARSGLTQGVVSRAADPEYGNLTLNTVIRIAAGFDMAFLCRFVPFSELGHWFLGLSDEPPVPRFDAEDGAHDEVHRLAREDWASATEMAAMQQDTPKIAVNNHPDVAIAHLNLFCGQSGTQDSASGASLFTRIPPQSAEAQAAQLSGAA